MSIEDNYEDFKYTLVSGRYITNRHIASFLQDLPSSVTYEVLGESVQKRPIYGLTVGDGEHRILIWSQMHGNESTTTKAVLDILNGIRQGNTYIASLVADFTLCIIPILNPDGAEAYTRVNFNAVDLNRDAQDLSQPESRILRSVFKSFKPHYCYNLHDQRTLFSAGAVKFPATVSFLAPAFDLARNVSPTRLVSMQLIVAMNKMLQQFIPNQIGRYDDGFNFNCVGDAFQMENVPTILFEAGHFPNDYSRDVTRKYIALALLESLNTILNRKHTSYTQVTYEQIPENEKFFCDILIHNVHLINRKFGNEETVAIGYREHLQQNQVLFIPEITASGNGAVGLWGHLIADAAVESHMQLLEEKGILELLRD